MEEEKGLGSVRSVTRCFSVLEKLQQALQLQEVLLLCRMLAACDYWYVAVVGERTKTQGV